LPALSELRADPVSVKVFWAVRPVTVSEFEASSILAVKFVAER
jgi:hypothetical protein